MEILKSIFNWRGRLHRAGFWLQSVAVWIVFLLASSVFTPTLGSWVAWLLTPIALWALVSIAVRRLHDRNLSGKWLLVILIPIVGALWLVWQLAIRQGNTGSNPWGNDPLVSQADFLVVR
jgi:uncharacterized membrane protein YhaH (DUF805 family)